MNKNTMEEILISLPKIQTMLDPISVDPQNNIIKGLLSNYINVQNSQPIPTNYLLNYAIIDRYLLVNFNTLLSLHSQDPEIVLDNFSNINMNLFRFFLVFLRGGIYFGDVRPIHKRASLYRWFKYSEAFKGSIFCAKIALDNEESLNTCPQIYSSLNNLNHNLRFLNKYIEDTGLESYDFPMGNFSTNNIYVSTMNDLNNLLTAL